MPEIPTGTERESALEVIGPIRRTGARKTGVSLIRNGSIERALQQKTLKNPIHCSGIGLHSGTKVRMTLLPAPIDSGILFCRSDLPGAPEIAADWRNAVETPMCASIAGPDGASVRTVEHLMSALAGCGIDNAVVDLDGPEVPAMDGSAAPFVFLIECAGVAAQDAARRCIEVRREVTLSDSERSISLKPGHGLSIDFEIDFASPAVARQEWDVRITPASYKRDVARARTFGFLHEVDRLREAGLAQGGSLDNAVVIDGEQVLNEGGLRYDDEFVRHKVLDLIGDLYLAGGPLQARVRGVRAGHSMTLRLLRTLFADRAAWIRRDMSEADLEPLQGATVPPARAVAAWA